MTTGRVTQTPITALYDTEPAARVTQSATLAVYSITPQARATQIAVLALCNTSECLRQTAQCWRITRADGEVFAYTAHDEPIFSAGTTFEPCDSLRPTAIQSTGNPSEQGAGDVDLVGLISSDGIREEDLFGGLFDNARVEVFEIDWVTGVSQLLTVGVVSRVLHGPTQYTATVNTGAVCLTQQPLLTTYTPGCRHVFGDSRCGISLASVTVTGSVTALNPRDAVDRTRQRVFYDSTRTEVTDYFTFGVVTWTSGANLGIRAEVRTFDATKFELWDILPNEIEVGDTYSLTPGCPKTATACQTKWATNNFVNFGGFPHIPGKDALYETPDYKETV